MKFRNVLTAGVLSTLTLVMLFWFMRPEFEQSVCGSVGALDLPALRPSDAPEIWQGALRSPGTTQELADGLGRFVYQDARNGYDAQFSHDGAFHQWTPKTAEQYCRERDDYDGISCTFENDENGRFGFTEFEKGHFVEMDLDYVSASAMIFSAGQSKILLWPPNSEDREGAECALARMIWELSGTKPRDG